LAHDSARVSFQSTSAFYVVEDDGALTLQPVTVKSYESGDVVITSGVEEGAKIVAPRCAEARSGPAGADRAVTVVLGFLQVTSCEESFGCCP